MRLLPKLAGPVLVLAVLSQAQTLTSEYIRLNGRVISTIHSPLQALSDVPPGVPYFELAHVMLEKGITTGCAAGSPPYCPGDPVTRGQMAAFIVRSIYAALKGDKEAFTCFNPSNPATQVSCDSTSPYFIDVQPGNVFYRYVQKLYQLDS
jgi:hypothetical protein